MRIAFVILLIIPLPGFSQQNTAKDHLLFTHFTSRDGLSNDETTCVLEDQRGFIWIGTTNGLNFYSANTITVYRNEPSDSSSLPDNIINALAEDTTRHLWIATVGGLSKMNLSTRKIEKVYRQDGKKEGNVRSSFILLYDKQNHLWSADFGIDLYDPSCECFHHYYNTTYSNEGDYKISNTITALFQDSKNRIWAGTRKGLFRFDPATGKFTRPQVSFSSETENSSNYSLTSVVTQIFEDHQHQLWLGTWGNGLVKFVPEEHQLISFPIKTEKTRKTSEFNIVSKISETKDMDNHYRLWVSSDQGFAEFSPEQTFIFQRHTPQDRRSPSPGGIRQLYASRSGILWIATETEGVDLLDPYRQVFKTHYFTPAAYAPATQFGSVNSVFSTGDSTWIATWYGNAVYIADRDFRILKKWQRIPPGSTSEENNRTNDFFRDKKGKLWISTFHGLHRLDIKTSVFQSYYHNNTDSTSLPNDRVIKYFEDSEGIAWVCFYKKGLCKFNPQTGRFYDYVKGVKNSEGYVSYFNIWDIMEDKEHNLWLADDALGLWKYDRKKRKLERMFINELHDGHIATIAQDNTNTIWVTTRNGLGKIKNDTFQLLTQADGLPTNTFFGARTDSQDRLWILSNQGTILYDEKKKTIKVFKEEDGLEKIAVDGAVLYRLKDGRMVIGGNHYVTEFDPGKVAFNPDKPAIYITDFKLFGKPYAWAETKKGKTITLSYDMNQFSFDFAVLNYSNPEENKFYYQLTGLDKDWNTSTQGFANYTNLDDGRYVFRVKGSNSDGAMNESGDTITIIIRPPFWRTWWFIGLCIAAALLLIYLLFRYRLRQALKLERIRMRISTDLHDDIGSTLSSISILSNMALQEGIHSSARDMISEIKDNSFKLMERMDDIVWSINPENDTLNGLLLRVKQFSSKLFEVKGIDYEFDIPPTISGARLSMEYNQHIYLILKEAINNMVKYACCSKAIIHISFASPHLTITISDNGKGFRASSSFPGNGIKSMKNRAQLMNAKLVIDATEDKGTVISLHLKIK